MFKPLFSDKRASSDWNSQTHIHLIEVRLQIKCAYYSDCVWAGSDFNLPAHLYWICGLTGICD